MKLYFGNAVTTATTLMTLVLLGFIGYSAHHRAAIACWGLRSAASASAGVSLSSHSVGSVRAKYFCPSNQSPVSPRSSAARRILPSGES